MLIGGTFTCILIMCPKGSISGPRVKVAAKLVRPSDLLFDIFFQNHLPSAAIGIIGCGYSPIHSRWYHFKVLQRQVVIFKNLIEPTQALSMHEN